MIFSSVTSPMRNIGQAIYSGYITEGYTKTSVSYALDRKYYLDIDWIKLLFFISKKHNICWGISQGSELRLLTLSLYMYIPFGISLVLQNGYN